MKLHGGATGTSKKFVVMFILRPAQKNNFPKISVILPVYNDSESLFKCLKALKLQDFDSKQFEVIVVDNGSKYPVKIEDIPLKLNIVVELSPGSYAARNTGISLAQGEILAFTDADCIPAQNWLSSGFKELLKHGHDTIIGGEIDVQPAKPEKPNLAESYDIALGLRQERYITMGNFAATANMITWKSLFQEVGLFNNKLKSGGDYEWGNRAIRLDKKIVYCPNVIVTHPARNSLVDIINKTRRITGGIEDIKKEPQLDRYDGIKGTPFATIQSIINNKKLPKLHHKFAVLYVAIIVFSVTNFEKIRLFMGFGSKRE